MFMIKSREKLQESNAGVISNNSTGGILVIFLTNRTCSAIHHNKKTLR